MTASLQSPPLDATETAMFRRFNRMNTRFIRTLNERLLPTEFPPAEARVLYELPTRTAPNASEICDALSLDPGYLSRLLAKLEQNGLLRRKASEHDARFAELSLTAKGKSAFKKL